MFNKIKETIASFKGVSKLEEEKTVKWTLGYSAGTRDANKMADVRINQLEDEIKKEHSKGIHRETENNNLTKKNRQLEAQIEQMKKDYPFFDDADCGDYTLKDGKALEDKDVM